jgi:Fe-S-cluster containining protein
MAEGETAEHQDLAAGRFSDWLVEFVRAQQDEGGAIVPCGECTACCTSSQFIHIGPEEIETISRIPGQLLFPVPGLPEGNVLMGYDDKGQCPMFADGKCSIYEHRPRTCRTYDCRVFPATGLELQDEDKRQILERTRRWRFEFSTPLDSVLRSAVLAAATYLRDQAQLFPLGLLPRNQAQLGFLAIQIHDVFLEHRAESADVIRVTPPLDVVEAAVRSVRARG